MWLMVRSCREEAARGKKKKKRAGFKISDDLVAEERETAGADKQI